jgi:hypothetical protein
VLSQRTHTIFYLSSLSGSIRARNSSPTVSRDPARRSVTLEPREVSKTTQQFTYQGDHLVDNVAVLSIRPVTHYCNATTWWATYPGLPGFHPPSAECVENATLLREKILRFQEEYPDLNALHGNPLLHFFTDAPPYSITGQRFVGAGYPGEHYAAALPQNAYREPGTNGAQVYTLVGRFGSQDWHTATEWTEYVYRNAAFQFFIVGSVPIDRSISSDPISHAIFGRDEDWDQFEERGLVRHEEQLAAQAAYGTPALGF